MIISKLNYYQHKGEDTFWELQDVRFGNSNLIVGLNATGKTRLLNVIASLAGMISKKISYLKDGTWKLEFKDKKNIYYYELETLKEKVIREKLKLNEKLLLDRKGEDGEIWSNIDMEMLHISPPKDSLTSHVRRDRKEYPYFEDILNWANNFYRFSFSGADPQKLALAESPEIAVELSNVPYFLKEVLPYENTRENISENFTKIGYPIEGIDIKEFVLQNIPQRPPIIILKEKDLNCMTQQLDMSQGMYRAFSVIVILEYFLKKNESCSIFIDDLGEGLDYDRSSKLTDLLFNKVKGTNIQLIVTSNDRFLINSVDIKYLNILERKGHVVKAYNYFNSKKIFDEFLITGLNNFDFFSDKMYREN